MNEGLSKSWFTIDGTLEEIDYEGESYFRFTKELAEIVIKKYSKEGDWILDPFVGFGTTTTVAQELNRNAIGFEVDQSRAEFAAKGLKEPNRIIQDRIENIGKYDLPKFDLVFTSPPYITVRLEDDPWGKTYFQDMEAIFRKIKTTLNPDATVVVEVSNLRRKEGIRTLAWQFGDLLSAIYKFQGEIIGCYTGDNQAGPGYNHSYLLVYKI
jgi:DNA modification methylase